MAMKLFTFLEKQIDEAKPEPVDTIIAELKECLSFKLLAIHLAVSYIANTISKCEIKRFVDGVETKDKFYYLFNVSPNTNENASELKFKLFYQLYLQGEALVVEHKGNLYVADSFGIEEHPLGENKFTNIAIGTETIRGSKKASDVFYLKLDGKKLSPLIDIMGNNYTEVLKYAFDRFKASAGEKYKLELANVKAGDKEFNEMFEKVVKKQLKDFIDNPKAIYPQFQGYNLEKLTGNDTKTDSTDVRNLRKEMFETVAQVLKIPVGILYGNMTNTKELISMFISFVIEPLTKQLNEELTRKTGTMDEFLKGTYFKVDITSIIHVDLFEIAEKVDKFIGSGVYCIDEIRHKLDEKPLNTEYSKQHWMTKNYGKIEDVMNGLEDSKKGGE